MTNARTRQAQKSPRAAGRFAMIGAPTERACNTSADDFRNLVEEEPKMQPIYDGTRARVSATPAVRPSFPDPSAIRRFVRFVADLQRDNGGQPVITTPAEIERATGVSASDQIAIRQQLMLAGRLRLSVVGNAWAYSMEAQS